MKKNQSGCKAFYLRKVRGCTEKRAYCQDQIRGSPTVSSNININRQTVRVSQVPCLTFRIIEIMTRYLDYKNLDPTSVAVPESWLLNKCKK
jgi:hypothetical protein